MKDRDDILEEIRTERMRQIQVEQFTCDHDYQANDDSQLALAAAAYCLTAAGEPIAPGFCWPRGWDRQAFKPRHPRRDLVRAAALILAEIERIERT